MLVSCSPISAFTISVALLVLFVSSIYVWRHAVTLPRDDPKQILRRFISVTLVSTFAPFSLVFCRTKDFTINQEFGFTLAGWLGLPMFANKIVPYVLLSLLPLFITLLLFCGPLVCYILSFSCVKTCAKQSWSIALLPKQRLIRVRNLLVSPFCEEWVFRACVCSLLLGSGLSLPHTSLLSSMLFGLAHVHHLVAHIHDNAIPLATALAIVLFQFFYSSVFGCFASFVFIRTGNLLACVLCHSFCNCMGFPDFSWTHSKYPHRKVVTTAYAFGIVAFSLSVVPLTSPELHDSVFLSLLAKQ